MSDTIRGVLTDGFGRVISGASVQVNKTGTTNAASLYSDAALTVAAANPLTTGLDGAYGPVFAPPGRYDLVFTASGYSFTAADSVGENVTNPTRSAVATGTYTVDDRDVLIYADATAGNVTINLPALSGILLVNRQLRVYKTDSSANTVTIARNGTDTINGATSVILLNQYDEVMLVGSTSGWKAIVKQATATPTAGYSSLYDSNARLNTNAPAASATMSADQAVASGVNAQVALDVTVFDTNNNLSQKLNCTTPIASPGVVTLNNHGFIANNVVIFATTGALPTGLTAGTIYYVLSAGLTSNTFEVAATSGGTAINFTGSTSGQSSVGSPGRFLPTVPGKYLITGTLSITVTTPAAPRIMFLKNSAAYESIGLVASVTTLLEQSITVIMDMNGTTDYVELWGNIGGTNPTFKKLSNGGGAAAQVPGSYFAAVRVSI